MTSAGSTPVIATPANSTPSSRPTTPNPNNANLQTPPPTSAVSDKAQDDTGKLRLFVSLLKKFIGVPDISAVRFSLPAQLIEPIPNLEYWHYLDRPETFVSIGQSDDELGRMLEVLRFWFTKDLKYVKGKPCKPYNSVLGEFFRCNWEVSNDAPPINDPANLPEQSSVDPLAPVEGKQPIRLSYITEQTSHHPPVSAYYMECPERGIYAYGYDQISAKFTGVNVRVSAGNFNQGIFITLSKRGDEHYQLTHPDAYLNGLYRGSLYVSVSDSCFITCPQTKLKTILTYPEEGWTKVQNKVTGIVFKYDPEDDKYIRAKDVPEKDILVKIDGCWKEQIFCWMTSGKESKLDKLKGNGDAKKQLLVDVTPMMPVPKICPPPEEQLPNESRRFWQELTTAIQEKRFADANRIKQTIEQNQRDKTAERKANDQEWKVRFFTEATEPGGQPHLSEDGKQTIAGMQKKEFVLKENEMVGA